MQLQPGFCQCWQETWHWSCRDKTKLHSGTIVCEIKFLILVQWAEALYELMGQSALEAGSAWLKNCSIQDIFTHLKPACKTHW